MSWTVSHHSIEDACQGGPMPLANIFLFTMLALVGIVAALLLYDYYQAEKKAKADMRQLMREAQYERSRRRIH